MQRSIIDGGADATDFMELVRGSRMVFLEAPEFHGGESNQKEEKHHAAKDEVVIGINKNS